jgi:glycine hydroxymethyltransferase
MRPNPLSSYLKEHGIDANPASVAYVAALEAVSRTAPEISRSIVRELEKQRTNIKLIASENYCSLPVQLAMGNLLTDKYAEGVPRHRFYAGNDNVDDIEELAQSEARALFGAEYANVQPHCGADANLMAYWAILATRVEAPALQKLGETNLYKISDAQWAELRAALGNQRLLGQNYFSGGHLTHGYRYNLSARMFDVSTYSVRRDTFLLDYDEIEAMARDVKPLILLAGYSAYPRKIDFKRMREIADSVGAVLMVDMAHFAGLVAGGVFTGDYSPFPFAHVVTTTTHKTLRGPRAGIVFSTAEFADALDKGCPLMMGGPLPHVVAAKAVALREAAEKPFKAYSHKIVENAQALAKGCISEGFDVLTGGTDNHLILVNVTGFGLTGRQAESALHECGITLNRNSLPYDANGPWYTSGLRIGTPAVTTLGMGPEEMREIASIMKLVLAATKPETAKDGSPSRAKFRVEQAAKETARGRVKAVLDRFPVYPELDLAFLKGAFCDAQ